MVSYTDLDPNAPFATVFTVKGMGWAAKIVSIGALFGEFYDSFEQLGIHTERVFMMKGSTHTNNVDHNRLYQL